MPTIALVDQDRNLLSSLASHFEGLQFKVEAYTDGGSAMSGIASNPPDIVLVDVGTPRVGGVEVVDRIRLVSDAPVVLVSARRGEDEEVSGLSRGADDFVRKPFSHRLLGERVKAVLRRSGPRQQPSATAGRHWTDRGDLRLATDRYSCTWKGNAVTLTVTEFRILESLASRPGVIKGRDALVDVAYPEGDCPDPRSIDSHVKRIRRKIRATDPAFDRIRTSYGTGYSYEAA